MTLGWVRWARVGALLLLLLVSCTRHRGAREERLPLPDPVEQYTTTARHSEPKDPDLAQLELQVLAALAQRGDQAEVDDSLNDAASWLLRESHAGREVDPVGAETSAHLFGFAGVVASCAVFDSRSVRWRDQVSRLPSNFRVNRVGLRRSAWGNFTAIVFGGVHLQLDPLPRAVDLGQGFTVAGGVSSLFKASTIYVQKPDGLVDSYPVAETRFSIALQPQVPGEYRVEVMGDGDSGPMVLSNLSIGVGVPATGPARVTGTKLPPDQAEARLLELLNAARRDMQLQPLASDPLLRSSALLHSQDMRDHRFFSHVSPTAGTIADRFPGGDSAFTGFGENIALASHPEGIHQGLMSSPGHRSAMISSTFTHVGIGVVALDQQLIATFHFGRRPGPEAVPKSAAQLMKSISDLRASKGLDEVRGDAAFAAAAAAGAKAFAKGSDTKQVARVVGQVVQAQVDNLVLDPTAYCVYQVEVLEAEQLDTFKPLLRPKLRRLGVGVQRHGPPESPRAATVILVDVAAGVACE